MSGLQGKTTLSDAEKVTEAQKHIEALLPHIKEMAPNEQDFIQKLADNFKKYGLRTFVSNKQLFWLRDLRINF